MTYRGAKQLLPTDQGPDGEPRPLSVSGGDDTNADESTGSFLPVLRDVAVSTPLSRASTNTFASSRPGCGLIEVSRYGAIPLPSEGKTSLFA